MTARYSKSSDIDGKDLQILIEADFIVNLYEDSASKNAVRNAYEKIFVTESGRTNLALCSPCKSIQRNSTCNHHHRKQRRHNAKAFFLHVIYRPFLYRDALVSDITAFLDFIEDNADVSFCFFQNLSFAQGLFLLECLQEAVCS